MMQYLITSGVIQHIYFPQEASRWDVLHSPCAWWPVGTSPELFPVQKNQ